MSVSQGVKAYLKRKTQWYPSNLRRYCVGFLNLLANFYQHPKEWWQLASPVWKILFFGYLVVFVSVEINFEPTSSGAVLVLTALIADLLLPRTGLYRAYNSYAAFKGVIVRGQNKRNYNFYGIYRIPQNESKKCAELISQNSATIMFPEPRPALYALANEQERGDVKQFSNYGWWQIHQTFERVQKVIVTCIALSGIIGTAVWGYGHLYWR